MSATPPLHIRDWMRQPGFAELFQVLGMDQARFVGGCVRDSLLDVQPHDVDVACQLRPEQVLERLEAAKIRCLATGLKHGTVTALLRDKSAPQGWRSVEITSLREDVTTDGRHAQVAFTSDWHRDAARRDLTMNALYLGYDGQIYDPLGTGLTDARQGQVRFVGDPSARIKEDYLRLLRYFRFAAGYARRPLEHETLDLCEALAPGLERLSGERIQSELIKLLSNPRCGPILEIMEARRIMGAIWPGPRPVDQALACLQRFADINTPPDPLLILRAWLGVEAPDLATIAERLRLSTDARAQFGHPLVDLDADETRLVYLHGHRQVANSALLASQADWSPQRLDRIKAVQPPSFPLSGRHLLAAGVPAGPEVGCRLAMTERWWIEGGFRADEAACLAWALEQNYP